MFSARDERTGKAVWQTRLASAPNGTPLSFVAAGRQYVAVASGAAQQ